MEYPNTACYPFSMFRDGEDLELALVEDSRAFQIAWLLRMRGKAVLHCFDSPSDFWERATGDRNFLLRLDAVVIDNRFRDQKQTGIGLARQLRSVSPSTRLVLSSNGHFFPHELEAFDLVVGKGPVPMDVLLGRCTASREAV